MIVALATLTYAIIEAPDQRLAVGPDAVLFAVCAVGASPTLIAYELRRRPTADRGPLLRQRTVLGRERDRPLRVHLLGGFLFLNTLYLQESRGLCRSTRGCTRCRWPRAAGDRAVVGRWWAPR